jgi:multiple sugar transport system permease protein
MAQTVETRTGTLSKGIPAQKRRLDIGQVLSHLALMLLVIIDIIPLIWVVLASFKTLPDLSTNPGWPNPWTFSNYNEIILRANFVGAFLNSVWVAGARVILALVTASALGFVFAKYRFPGRDTLFAILLSTMMVPFVVRLIPLYVTLSDFKLTNRVDSLIVIAMFSTIGTFILRQSIRDIPNELLDAARIDGAGEIWIYLRLIVPLSKAPLSALAVFTFLFSWDDFLFPSILLTKPDVQTLPLVLAGLRSIFWSRYELFSAGAMLTVVPVMILYSAMQKQFVRGIAMTGMK